MEDGDSSAFGSKEGDSSAFGSKEGDSSALGSKKREILLPWARKREILLPWAPQGAQGRFVCLEGAQGSRHPNDGCVCVADVPKKFDGPISARVLRSDRFVLFFWDQSDDAKLSVTFETICRSLFLYSNC